jgi:PIN domain nuclease of toxin-antitoxin system
VAAYWEVVIKSAKGLLNVADPIRWWERATQDLTTVILSIQPQHIAALSALPDIHRDPFDRILISQAIVEGCAIITRDEAVRRYSVKTVW